MRRIQIVSRVAAGVLGGWSFTWGFLVYLVVFCWSFAAASTARVWLVLFGGGAAMTGLGWWMTRLPST